MTDETDEQRHLIDMGWRPGENSKGETIWVDTSDCSVHSEQEAVRIQKERDEKQRSGRW